MAENKVLFQPMRDATRNRAKKVLAKLAPLFCDPLNRNDTRLLPFLETLHCLSEFTLKELIVNEKSLEVKVSYPQTRLLRAEAFDGNFRILPSGGLSFRRSILSTGFEGHQSFNILGYLQSFYKRSQAVSGTIIASWPYSYLTYGDFVLQLLPELCLVKSILSSEEWRKTHFILPQTPAYLFEYLSLLGCSASQVINSRMNTFGVQAGSKVYFREKDPLDYLCAPAELLSTARNSLLKLPRRKN